MDDDRILDVLPYVIEKIAQDKVNAKKVEEIVKDLSKKEKLGTEWKARSVVEGVFGALGKEYSVTNIIGAMERKVAEIDIAKA